MISHSRALGKSGRAEKTSALQPCLAPAPLTAAAQRWRRTRATSGSSSRCFFLSFRTFPSSSFFFVKSLFKVLYDSFYGRGSTGCGSMQSMHSMALAVVHWGWICAINALTSMVAPELDRFPLEHGGKWIVMGILALLIIGRQAKNHQN